MPISAIDPQSILKDPSHTDLEFLNAYGSSIIPSTDPSLHFNFSTQESSLSKLKTPILKKPINYKLLVKTALICISLIVLSIIASGLWTQKLKQDISVLNQKLGPSREIDISMTEKNEIRLSTKLTNFKNIRMHSDTASFLALIPELLPEGTWIEGIDIAYDDSAALGLADRTAQTKKSSKTNEALEPPALLVTIKGYAYSEDRNEQFLLVNRLLRNLKKDEEFSAFFNNINLETTEAQKLFQTENTTENPSEYSVTAFKIVCLKENEPKRPE